MISSAQQPEKTWTAKKIIYSPDSTYTTLKSQFCLFNGFMNYRRNANANGNRIAFVYVMSISRSLEALKNMYTEFQLWSLW